MVEHWRLKKSNHSHPFSFFSNETTRLVISGIGKCNSAAATAWLAGITSTQRQRNSIWINLGIAGHGSLPIGTLVCANRIIDTATSQTWYPTLIKNKMRKESIKTVDNVVEDYPADFAVEMEASGFYATATKISTSELIHCFKVISDNQISSVLKITPQLVQTLIGDNLAEIHKQLDVINTLSKQCEQIDSSDIEAVFYANWKFSTTQKNQLKRLLHRVLARTGSFDAAQVLLAEHASTPSNTAEVLLQLHNISSTSEHLH